MMNQMGNLEALSRGQPVPQQQQEQPQQDEGRREEMMAMLEEEPEAKQIVGAMIQSAKAGKPFDEEDIMRMLEMSRELGD